MNSQTQLAGAAVDQSEEIHEYECAVDFLTKKIENNPRNHELYLERSICHHKLGNHQASLDDAETSIRLDGNHFNVHYQRALALIGLSRVNSLSEKTALNEAVTSFKKAIELRARQEDVKLSEIYYLIRDAIKEMDRARRRPDAAAGDKQGQPSPQTTTTTINTNTAVITSGQNLPNGSGGDPVDSTTDRLRTSASNKTLSHPTGQAMLSTDQNNLVVTNCNNNSAGNIKDNINANTMMVQPNRGPPNGLATGLNGVTSSANLTIQNNGVASHITFHKQQHASSGLEITSANQSIQQQTQFDWNIRRSERIFLHASDSPTDINNQHQQYNVIGGQAQPGALVGPNQVQRTKIPGSNPSSIGSGARGTKRPHDSQHLATKTPDETNSHVESDVDVDDSRTDISTRTQYSDPSSAQKRVVITPSSSMPASGTGTEGSSSGKDDSYSSKYKRLRRDRERARRGTSKLCTIKPSDLEDLQKSSNLGKKSMRVIAPIDGWLYSGSMSIDDSRNQSGTLQFVVKLDGDTTGSSYLFTQDTVLNDVIKEVKVKSVSELRKGARICCYWSRQYKCLSTGVVTSRTFEATKSLVSVKYDNGDLSALPLEDLRLLPPDYPKYMSNCDPLLLARNGDGPHTTVIMTNPKQQHHEQQQGESVVIENKPPVLEINQPNGVASHSGLPMSNLNPLEFKLDGPETVEPKVDPIMARPRCEFIAEDDSEVDSEINGHPNGDGTIIPQTNQILDFITGDDNDKPEQDSAIDLDDRPTSIQGTTSITDTNLATTVRQATENTLAVEYQPWVFEGPSRRSKRHGRAYRDIYSAIRRGEEVIRVGDAAELMPLNESILPFIGKVDSFWANVRGEMRVKVRWYYRLTETAGEPRELKDGENALFETDHPDENDVQSIYRSAQILPWDDYQKAHMGHMNKTSDMSPKIYYLAGYYDPVKRVKHLRADVKETL